jgi:2-(1,2-epoxy-1,2-dihydrophenyl)acetyl-CoA isomerase
VSPLETRLPLVTLAASVYLIWINKRTDDVTSSTAPPAAGSPAARSPERIAAELYQVLADGDGARLAALLHPGFEGQVTEGLPLGLGGSYHGPEAMRHEFWGQIARSFDAKAEPASYCPLPDGRLMVTGRYTGAARGGGALDAEFVHFLTFSGDQVIGLVQLTDSARWASALAGRLPEERPAEQTPVEEGPASAEEGPAARPTAMGPTAGPAPARDEPVVSYSNTGGLGILLLNRPGARNAIDQRFVDDLYEAVQRCAADESQRALLIRAMGPSFTIGGDAAMLAQPGPAGLAGLLRRTTTSYHASLQILDRLPVPVVAAVHGAVAGGGLGLMNVADMVLAAEGTRFATGFAGLGLSGDGGGTWFLPRLVGARRAAELYFGQRVLEAGEALEWGLVTQLVRPEDLQAEAETVGRQLAAGPTRAFAELKTLLRASPGARLGEQMLAETAAICRTAGTRDAGCAIAGFLAKSRTEFQGW